MFTQGGSFGRGTCLKSRSDIDMVLNVKEGQFINDSGFDAATMSRFLNMVKDMLQNSLLSTKILVTEVTPLALRFQYSCYEDNHLHHIDLLPCNDFLGATPTKSKLQKFFFLFI